MTRAALLTCALMTSYLVETECGTVIVQFGETAMVFIRVFSGEIVRSAFPECMQMPGGNHVALRERIIYGPLMLPDPPSE